MGLPITVSFPYIRGKLYLEFNEGGEHQGETIRWEPDYGNGKIARIAPDIAPGEAKRVVEVKGSGDPQSFDFGRSVNIVLDWDSKAVNLVDQATFRPVMKEVTEMTVTLK